ncbi:hypothetical protein Scep_021272 [Stephania cephalantha]|uniref:Uncharacterized protein n=1 Tax=Stephania cephalantha TaxID=152367 RepID=A0AAP0HWQ4_9MAGN
MWPYVCSSLTKGEIPLFLSLSLSLSLSFCSFIHRGRIVFGVLKEKRQFSSHLFVLIFSGYVLNSTIFHFLRSKTVLFFIFCHDL